jgi:threonine 3-dehydrogenase
MSVKAPVKSRREPGLWLEEIEPPKIGINDVLIKVLRTGICGTDIHIYKWDEWAQATIPVPMAIGHEFVGRIVEAISSAARATWSAAAAATAWREDATCAPTRWGWG